jgi:hypothetical protein
MVQAPAGAGILKSRKKFSVVAAASAASGISRCCAMKRPT